VNLCKPNTQAEHVLRTRTEGLKAHFLGAAPQTPQKQQQKQNLPNESGVGLAVGANDLNLLPNEQKGTHNRLMGLR
jgi:hypothetical protein